MPCSLRPAHGKHHLCVHSKGTGCSLRLHLITSSRHTVVLLNNACLRAAWTTCFFFLKCSCTWLTSIFTFTWLWSPQLTENEVYSSSLRSDIRRVPTSGCYSERLAKGTSIGPNCGLFCKETEVRRWGSLLCYATPFRYRSLPKGSVATSQGRDLKACLCGSDDIDQGRKGQLPMLRLPPWLIWCCSHIRKIVGRCRMDVGTGMKKRSKNWSFPSNNN